MGGILASKWSIPVICITGVIGYGYPAVESSAQKKTLAQAFTYVNPNDGDHYERAGLPASGPSEVKQRALSKSKLNLFFIEMTGTKHDQ
jgi:hypothetical protein